MEIINKKCSSKDHIEINAISFCQICKIYMCNKCDNIHLKLCPNHCPYNLNENINEVFTGICNEENHSIELEYFCKSHNKLCCAACISKIKGKGNGQHTDCEVCFIENIKDEKKNKLKDNIKCLEDLSQTLQKTIIELKNLLEKIDNNKEELKIKIQKIFTQLRTALNDREDQLLIEVDKQFNYLYLNRDSIKESENLPNKIKIFLEKGKIIDENWNNDKLASMINDCINIENNIQNINKLNENLYKNNLENIIIKFSPEDDKIIKFCKEIKNFGNIICFSNYFDSKIINKIEKIKFQNLIFPNIQNPFNNLELLYRLSRDDEKINTFHRLCDNIKNNLIIIQTENNDIFGAYCNWEWDCSGNDINKSDGILFNFTKNKIFTNQKLSIHKGCNDHGPYIYSHFYFAQTMNKCNISSDKFNNKGVVNIKEVEIYKVKD